MAGAGNYRVDKGHAAINDAASNYSYAAGPDETTFDLAVGGLVADAEIGDLVVFNTSANDYVVKSNGVATLTVNGDCSGEADPDAITIDAFDTIQDAVDELEEDQGVAAFTSEQRINVYTGSGAYTEVINLNFNFVPRSRYRLKIQAASGQSPVQNVNTLAYIIGCDSAVPYVTFSGFTVTGTLDGSLNYGLAVYFVSLHWRYESLTVTATGYVLALFGTGPHDSSLIVADCSFTGPGASKYLIFSSSGTIFLRRCTVKDFLSMTFRASTVRAKGCIFDTISGAVFLATAASYTGQHEALNCDFYNCGGAWKFYRGGGVFTALNCVFHTVTNICEEGYADSKLNAFGETRFEDNCYHGVTKWLESITDADITTFSAWQAAGYDIDGQEADPLFTNPGAGIFTLQSTSPCRKAGRGAGVPLDRAGAAFDPYHPDQGAYSSGVVGAVPGTPSAEYMSAGLNVHVHLDGDAGADNYARLIDKNNAVVDEDSITGDGSVGLVATTPGPHAVVAWSADEDDIVRSKPTTVFPFECLTFAVPGATVQFELGPDQVVLTAPIPGPTERDVHHDASLITAAGVRYAYNKGVQREELELTFESLTESEKLDLKDFYDRIAEGVVNLFQYTDSNGTLYSARFLEPTLEFTRVAVGVYDVSMLLELVEIT